LLQTRAGVDVSGYRRLCASTTSGDLAATAQASERGAYAARPSTLAQCLLRGTGAVHPSCSLCAGASIPMRQPPTGEPCAGEPPARFGGRGGREPFPTPMHVVFTLPHPLSPLRFPAVMEK